MKSYTVCWIVMFCLAFVMNGVGDENPRSGPSVDFSHGDLKVHVHHRFLMHADGTPFFYLGDTAWELFHRLNKDEAERYLENRRQKGFTVIQAVVLAELDGLHTPNAQGDKPLIDDDPTQPNEAYFKYVDFIVQRAEEKGMFIGMLPTWGDKVTKAWGAGPVVFTNEHTETAYQYGNFLGARYKNQYNIIWILIGDRNAEGYEAIWRAMAKGLREGDGGRHLITCHPQGGRSSADWFHNDDWLDFNTLQSGHGSYDNPNYKMIAKDYQRTPIKPCMDSEPRYEDHPVNWKPESGWFNDFDVRQAAYWGLFAGGFGTTYGCHDIWQMMAPGRKPISSARNNWYDVLDLPASWDMMHVRALMESRPFFHRRPDPSILASPQPTEPGATITASRGDDYAFVYTPYGDSFTVQMGKISGENVKAWWFDPRTGESQWIGEFGNQNQQSFDPPRERARANDWILVLDDAAKPFPKPGAAFVNES